MGIARVTFKVQDTAGAIGLLYRLHAQPNDKQLHSVVHEYLAIKGLNHPSCCEKAEAKRD